eukprot:scaffold18698_cov34-Phaeocystis_antarctica.AAC.1
MNRQTQMYPQRPGYSPTSNMMWHAGRLAQTASHTSTFPVLKIKSQPVTTRRRTAFCPHEEGGAQTQPYYSVLIVERRRRAAVRPVVLVAVLVAPAAAAGTRVRGRPPIVILVRKVVKDGSLYIYPRAMQGTAMVVAVAHGLPLVPPKRS